MRESIYVSGDYLLKNPTWGVEDSPWKAEQVLKMIRRNNLAPASICEVGCGAGEILSQLHSSMSESTSFFGYEISPQAFELCQQRAKDRLEFRLKDILEEPDVFFDVLLAIDVIEHVEDCFSFLRDLKAKGRLKMFHIPLDLSAQTVLRGHPLATMRRKLGHIHLFTKETAFAILEETGYRILDWFYTEGSLHAPGRSRKSALLRVPRQILYALRKDFAVRLLGGCSLMIMSE